MKPSNQDIIDEWAKTPTKAIRDFGDTGDFYRQYLLTPALLKILGDVDDKQILDAGCGNGYLSRLLARKGAKVTGVEPADVLYKYAISEEDKKPLGIKYLQQDLSELETDTSFDAVVSNMVFMDIPDFESAIKNCIKALKNGGDFIFSISHPCFEDVGDQWEERKRLVIKEYLNEYETKRQYGYSFHRTLSTYINYIISQGCEVVELIEPQLDQEVVKEHPEKGRDAHVPSFLIIYAVRK